MSDSASGVGDQPLWRKAMAWLGDALKPISKVVGVVTHPLKEMLLGLVDKIPGKFGKVLHTVVDKAFGPALVLSLGLLAATPLAAIGVLAASAVTVGNVGDMAEKLGKGEPFLSGPDEAKENAREIVAEAHANVLN